MQPSDEKQSCRYVDQSALQHLLRGLTFDTTECARLIDMVLIEMNQKENYSDRMLDWIANGKASGQPIPQLSKGRFIIQVNQFQKPGEEPATIAAATSTTVDSQLAPAIFFNMHSFTLDIPMRLEIPLRAIMKGNAPLAGTYVVYLHVLKTTNGANYLYYGITKRGWTLRFQEHTRAAFKRPKRALPKRMAELIEATADRRVGRSHGDQVTLDAIINALCAVGLTKDQALETEEYLVEKYSLAEKHEFGLNMIPGGRAGIAMARRFGKSRPRRPTD